MLGGFLHDSLANGMLLPIICHVPCIGVCFASCVCMLACLPPEQSVFHNVIQADIVVCWIIGSQAVRPWSFADGLLRAAWNDRDVALGVGRSPSHSFFARCSCAHKACMGLMHMHACHIHVYIQLQRKAKAFPQGFVIPVRTSRPQMELRLGGHGRLQVH